MLQDQKILHDLVQRRGGPIAVLHEQHALEELSAISTSATQPGERGGIWDLKYDLKDPEEAAVANLPSFERKLEIFQGCS